MAGVPFVAEEEISAAGEIDIHIVDLIRGREYTAVVIGGSGASGLNDPALGITYPSSINTFVIDNSVNWRMIQ